MKKLMFALAFAAVGSAFAIESSNIVGYMNKQLTDQGGTKLISASFESIGAEGMILSELAPKGYENNENMKGNDGTFGDFQIGFLNEGGEKVAQYSWNQDYDGEWQEGVWAEDYNTSGEDLSVIPAGTSVFFTTPIPEPGETYTLQNAGQIVTAQLVMTLPEGTCCIGNPRATALSIFKLVPGGYLDNDDMKGNDGTFGDFQIAFLNEGGEKLAQYSWNQDYDGEWQEGVWAEDYNYGVSTTLEPGDGIFVTGPTGYIGNFTLTIPEQTL